MMLNFKLGGKCDKVEITNMTRAWYKEKILSPHRETNPQPFEHRTGALSTEQRELMDSEPIQLSSCMTPSCILLGTTMSKSSW